MRGHVFGFALGLALLAASLNASAHAPGSPTITESGSFLLYPAGHDNSSYHANITSLGIPPGPGDTLRFSWSTNGGQGPAIYFEIHAHPNTTGYVRYYNTLADRADDSWSVPDSDPYMVLWNNPSPAAVNVTYTFQLFAPPDLSVLVVFPVILGVIVLLLVISRRRPRRPEP
ncbi:MAG: hypothetical protein ACREDF_12275 [Thermoplasmata archaeon]